MSSKDKDKKKPGLMKRLFSGKKLSVSEEPEKEVAADKKNKKLQRMHTVDPASLSRPTEEDFIASSGGAEKSSKPKPLTDQQKKKKKPPVRSDAISTKKYKKKGDKKDVAIHVDIDKPLEFPCTPEKVMAYHKAKPFLSHSEEWLIVELNEFECVIDSMDMIKIIAKHSKFFEVEPDELWEEFFEFVEEVPSYDEIINYDVWQEFRDTKYPM